MPASRLPYLAVCLNPVIQKTLSFPRLDPGEVNRTPEHRVDAAGKGVCCARVLVQLGREAVHLTQLGGPTREWFLAMCEADGVAVSHVESGSEIRFCVTVLDRAAGAATELVEEARPVGAGTEERLVEEFRRLLPGAGTVMLSGTRAAGYSDAVMPALARLAAEAGKRLVLDLKGRDLLACLPFKPAVVKPNLEELAETFLGRRALDLRSAEGGEAEREARDLVGRAGREWLERFGARLVVTRGRRPTLYWEGGALREEPVREIVALNPIGSGDAFNVGLATALEDGAGLGEAVAEGTRLGALNAERLKPGSIA